MRIARITKETQYTPTESLVRLEVDDAGRLQYFVAVASRVEGKLEFLSVEQANYSDATTYFNVRAMFNGQHIHRIMDTDNKTSLDASELTIINTTQS